MGAHNGMEKSPGKWGNSILKCTYTNTKFSIDCVVAKSYSKRKPCMAKTRAFTQKGLANMITQSTYNLHAWAI